MRDFCAAYHHKVTGYSATTKQLVTAWHRTNPRTGEWEEAKLDVATRDAVTGAAVYLDVSIACAHSDDQSRQRARSGRDGLAAQSREDDKRRRYPPHGGDLVPVVFETGGRPGDAAVAYVRSLAHGLEGAARTEVLRYAWQQLSCLLQVGNAEALLAAMGT